MQSPFVNIHTHNKITKDMIGIQSYCISDIGFSQEWPNSYSVGVHPWNIHKINIEQSLKQIEYIASETNMKAVGECGLDRAIARNFDAQYKVFISQISIAESFDKPMIVHNVRAFSDFLEILKNNKPAVPFVFHGFKGNKDILNKLIKFNVYFSVGAEMLINNSKTQRILPHIPLNRLFIETDEWEGDIIQLYEYVSNVKKLDVERIKNQIYYNYKSVFV